MLSIESCYGHRSVIILVEWLLLKKSRHFSSIMLLQRWSYWEGKGTGGQEMGDNDWASWGPDDTMWMKMFPSPFSPPGIPPLLFPPLLSCVSTRRQNHRAGLTLSWGTILALVHVMVDSKYHVNKVKWGNVVDCKAEGRQFRGVFFGLSNRWVMKNTSIIKQPGLSLAQNLFH